MRHSNKSLRSSLILACNDILGRINSLTIQHFNCSTRKAAFTLAEVLITLGIIGVVAALTMPSLIHKQQEKVIITQLKHSYAVFENAFKLAYLQDGYPDTWGIADSTSESVRATIILDKLAPFMKLSKNCGNNAGCWSDEYDTAAHLAKGVLNNGVMFYIRAERRECIGNYGNSKPLQNTCAYITIDVNGKKPPNQRGYDIFYFYITKYGIVPFGSQDETNYSFEEYCMKNNSATGCAAWAVFNGNRDYLYCRDDLSWDGKTACK